MRSFVFWSRSAARSPDVTVGARFTPPGGLNAHSDGERFGLRLWFPGELVVFHDDFNIGLPCVCGIVCGVGPDFDAYYLVCVERDGCILRGRLYVRESGVAQLGHNTVQVLTLAI